MKIEINDVGEIPSQLGEIAQMLLDGETYDVHFDAGDGSGAMARLHVDGDHCIASGAVIPGIRPGIYRGREARLEFSIEYEIGSIPTVVSVGPEESPADQRAAFWADAPSYTKETAPIVDPYYEPAGRRTLRERAEAAMARWGKRRAFEQSLRADRDA